MKYQLRVKRFGENEYGKWVLGQVSNGVICYNGLFRVESSQELSEGLIVNVKTIIVSYDNKNNKYSFKIIL